MRSRVEDTTREEKSDSQLDSGGVTRKHKAGKRREKDGDRESHRDGERSRRKRGRAAAEGRRKSRTETNKEGRGAGWRCRKKPAMGSMTKMKEKRIGAGTWIKRDGQR